MNPPRIELKVAGPQQRRPGDVIEGLVEFDMPDTTAFKYAEVSLFWRTEGKGTTNQGLAGRVSLCQEGERLPYGRSERPWSLPLPPLPWTYRGRLLSINWRIALFARPEGAEETALEWHFVLGGDPWSQPLPPESDADDDDVDLNDGDQDGRDAP